MATKETISSEEVQDLDEALEVIPFTYAITSYGADYPVDSLVKRIENNDIIVPRFSWQPEESTGIVGFQREYVWGRPKADRFIESLLLGLPVPGIFLVKEGSGRLLVLDGHQRLYTLHAYFSGSMDGEEYRLHNVQERFEGKRYHDLDVEDRRRLDDSIIHATVIRQDEPSEDQSSIYVIFERLNTGGVNLHPQEIRVALYHGPLVHVLQDLNTFAPWRAVFGKRSRRLKDMELILRFFAFFFHDQAYRAPMKDFLNRYMAANRNLERQSGQELRRIFESTVAVIHELIGYHAFRPRRALNAAVADSVMIAIARRLQAGPILDHQALKAAYTELFENHDYLAAVETGTSQEANVADRIMLATRAFAPVP